MRGPFHRSDAAWLYYRFSLKFRDVEDLVTTRGITVSYEAIRQWCLMCGPRYARRLKRNQGRLGDKWHLDNLFVTIRGRRHYRCRVVDQDSDAIDILVHPRRDRCAAERFFRTLLPVHGAAPRHLVTEKLRSDSAAHRTVMTSVMHRTARYEDNRAEVSHQPTCQRERQMRWSESPVHAQRFLSVHGMVRNLFRVGRHLLHAARSRMFRAQAFGSSQQVAPP